MKPPIWCLIAALLTLSIATPLSSSMSQQADDSETLMSKAWAVEGWDEGMPPVSLAADVQITDTKGTLIAGNYAFDWVSPTQWREHIKFNGYERLRVRDAKGYWQSRSVDFEPESIFQLSQLLRLQAFPRLNSHQFLGKVQDRNKDGVSLRCVDVGEAQYKNFIDSRLCFNPVDGTLSKIEYPTNQNMNPPEISEIVFEAFKPVGQKLVSTEIHALQGKKIISSVKVSQISLMGEPKQELFAKPENAQFWPSCAHGQNAELDRRVPPIYPPDAKSRHQSGTVSLYALIQPDGSVTHLLVIRSAGALLDAAAGQAVSQWHYKPAMCGSTPIPTETSITVSFHLAL
ncbi:MAG TPA: energy transducer TonB [Candidatus Sulfotelmatobacter sp.]|nr:energy transducer TonB [Candidatus Sulfotelmatobacter sp.]